MTAPDEPLPPADTDEGVAATESGPVLVAVDFSEDSKAAAIWAGRQADRLGTKLLILHVVHDPAASPGFYRKMGEDWLRPMSDVAGEMMTAFLDEVRSADRSSRALIDAEHKLVPGLPAGRIVEVAETVGARLVVVGSRGRTGLPRILLGSVAERVAQLAPMPVVVVKRR